MHLLSRVGKRLLGFFSESVKAYRGREASRVPTWEVQTLNTLPLNSFLPSSSACLSVAAAIPYTRR